MSTAEHLTQAPPASAPVLRFFQSRRVSDAVAHRNSVVVLTLVLASLATLTWIGLDADPATRTTLTLLAFGITIAAAEQWRLHKSLYSTATPVSSAVALALALTPASTHLNAPTSLIFSTLVAAILLGTSINVMTSGKALHEVLPDVGIRLAASVAATVLTALLPPLDTQVVGASAPGIALLGLIALVCILSDTGAHILLARHRQPANSSDLNIAAGLAASIAATAVMITVTLPIFSTAAIPLCILPLALVHMSERLHLRLRTSYQQSVDIFAHLNDISAHRPDGYCDQHAELSLAIGAQLGLRDRELRRLGYASKMHAVGMLRLSNAGSPRAAADLHSIAHHSTEILRDTGLPLQIDDILAAIPVPHHDTDQSIPLASRIIRVVSTYLTHRAFHPGPPAVAHLAAMEALYLGYCYEYDPRVIDALADLFTTTGTPRDIPTPV